MLLYRFRVICSTSSRTNCSLLLISGRMFTLWGNFDDFNYAKMDHITCAAPPASIGDWTGFWSGSRGTYCPRASDNQLTKNTWHGSGRVTSEVVWKAGSKITRLGPNTNIYGVSTDGRLLALWDERGVAVHSFTMDHLPSITGVRAVGGLDDVFVSNEHDRIYNVYWQGDWKEAEINIEDYHIGTGVDETLFFGSHKGKNYLLYGEVTPGGDCEWASFNLYRLNFVDGVERYWAEHINYGEGGLGCGHDSTFVFGCYGL